MTVGTHLETTTEQCRARAVKTVPSTAVPWTTATYSVGILGEVSLIEVLKMTATETRNSKHVQCTRNSLQKNPGS